MLWFEVNRNADCSLRINNYSVIYNKWNYDSEVATLWRYLNVFIIIISIIIIQWSSDAISAQFLPILKESVY